MTNQIFISYSKKDSQLTHKLAGYLKATGLITWIDKSIGADVIMRTLAGSTPNANDVWQ